MLKSSVQTNKNLDSTCIQIFYFWNATNKYSYDVFHQWDSNYAFMKLVTNGVHLRYYKEEPQKEWAKEYCTFRANHNICDFCLDYRSAYLRACQQESASVGRAGGVGGVKERGWDSAVKGN